MTDVSLETTHLLGRLGLTARTEDGVLILGIVPCAEVLHHGMIRASVLSLLIDVVAGITLDDDPDYWTLTSDMSVRMRPIPAPDYVEAVSTVLRRGRRSATATVELTTREGDPVASGAIGFAKLERRPDDPPKPQMTPGGAASVFSGVSALTKPLREEAGIEVLDRYAGEVQLAVTPQLRNSAGTLQGAMVALVGEAAAEELVSSRFDIPAVVTELDLRYLAQAPVGPVASQSRLLGTRPDSPVEVELVDTSVDRVTTLVYARLTSLA